MDSNRPFYYVYLQTGFFHLPHGDFFIEPVKKHPLAEGEYHPHIIYRKPRQRPSEQEEPTCGLKGIVTRISSSRCGVCFVPLLLYYNMTCSFSNLLSPPPFSCHRVCALVGIISLLYTLVFHVLNRKGRRHCLHPCYINR